MECNSCKTIKPVEEFTLKNGKPWKCKECHNKYQREYYGLSNNREKQRERVAQRRRSNPYLRKAQIYGISVEEVERLILGGCGICGATNPHIDHDHETGRVRGALCNTCNTGLGKLGDSVEGLEKAIEYLRAYRSSLIN